MATAKSGVQVIKEFFGGSRPVTMDEMKNLTAEERRELADGAAVELGLKKEAKGDGTVQYV